MIIRLYCVFIKMCLLMKSIKLYMNVCSLFLTLCEMYSYSLLYINKPGRDVWKNVASNCFFDCFTRRSSSVVFRRCK